MDNIRYDIVDVGNTIRKEYHSSPGHFFDEMRRIGDIPDGVLFMGGGDTHISVTFEPEQISEGEIRAFIEAKGLKVTLSR